MNRFEKMVFECMNPTAELLAKTSNPLHRAILLNFCCVTCTSKALGSSTGSSRRT